MQTPSVPKPSPARRRALLESAGIPEPTFTLHLYEETILEPDPDLGWLHPQWAQMFKCTKTGAVRKFGVVDATLRSDVNRRAEGRGLL